MAASKPEADTSKKKQPAKKSASCVVKRPTRGYHLFRHGMLNVTPKGGEKELVKRNQSSPLLRVPPELRNRIWEYVLGGREIKPFTSRSYRHRIVVRALGHKSPDLLLQVCRQVYVETAHLPCRLNTFRFSSFYELRKGAEILKSFQWAQITQIRMSAHIEYGVNDRRMRGDLSPKIKPAFRAMVNLKRISIMFLHSDNGSSPSVKDLVHQQIAMTIDNEARYQSIEVVFNITGQHNDEYI